MRPFDCIDYTCRYSFKFQCYYDRLWNKVPEGQDGCDGYHPGKGKLVKALRKKRGRVLLATNRTGFDYVGRKGLLFECLQRRDIIDVR